jgi:PQQ system protein
MVRRSLVGLTTVLMVSGCGYAKLLRPSVLKQLDPEMVALVNELPAVDHPNEAIVARLFVHGGLSHAALGADGIMRDEIGVPAYQYIWKPAVIVMPQPGTLELSMTNEDLVHHMAFLPNDGERQALDMPVHSSGKVSVALSEPGLYWFGCPVSNHAGRGMLGLIIVKGDSPPTAILDRPEQPQP